MKILVYALLFLFPISFYANEIGQDNSSVLSTNQHVSDDIPKEGYTPGILSLFRYGTFTPEAVYSGKLGKYNVVIAALAKKSSAERLKDRIDFDYETSFIAQSGDGLYYVIIGSYDTVDEAVMRRRGFLEKYMAKGSFKQLWGKYGILFEDIWFLVKK